MTGLLARIYLRIHSRTYSLLLSHFLPELKLFIPHTRARDACRKENTQSAVELDMYQRNEDTMLRIARRISAPKTLAYCFILFFLSLKSQYPLQRDKTLCFLFLRCSGGHTYMTCILFTLLIKAERYSITLVLIVTKITL